VKRKKMSRDMISPWENPEGFVADKVSYLQTEVNRSVQDVAAYTQLNPERALLCALGGGYLLRMLPVMGIVSGLIRLILMLIKPAAIFYGVAKIWQKAQPAITSASRTSEDQEALV
jgi:hypothetical protein